MTITRKTLLAAAVAAACAAPLAAQAQSTVTIYGKLYPQINSYKVSGATAAGRPVSSLSSAATGAPDVDGYQMESSNSRIGFRGTEDLGGGLKGIFQLETAFSVDTGALNTANVIFSRNTFVGLDGGFGTIKLGRMDSVYKELGDTLSFLGISSGNFVSGSNIIAQRGFGTNNADRFHERLGNSIFYESPEFGGFQGLFQYSLGEVAGDTSRGSVVSTGVKYEAGPLYAALAYERHDDFFGGSRNIPTARRNLAAGSGTGATFVPAPGTSSEDTSVRATVQYKLTRDTRVEVNFARTELDESGGAAGRFDNYRHNTWSIGGEQRIGPWTIAASYGQAGEGSCSFVGGGACSTDGLDGKMLNLGASYALSKRTQLFAIASLLRNGASARYSNIDIDPDPGQDIRQVALGVAHSF